jgi:hypothetical protein
MLETDPARRIRLRDSLSFVERIDPVTLTLKEGSPLSPRTAFVAPPDAGCNQTREAKSENSDSSSTMKPSFASPLPLVAPIAHGSFGSEWPTGSFEVVEEAEDSGSGRTREGNLSLSKADASVSTERSHEPSQSLPPIHTERKPLYILPKSVCSFRMTGKK